MASAGTAAPPRAHPAERAAYHSMLRFTFGTAGAFVLCEYMGWYPSFLAPLFAGVLLANVPTALPAKLGIMLVVIEAIGAYSAFLVTSALHSTPIVVFGMVSLVLFVCFANLARGGSFLPLLLVLVCFATIPIVTLVFPHQAGALPLAFVRAMAVAVVSVWTAHALWSATNPGKGAAPPAVSYASPLGLATAGSAIVLPVMLLYLLFGITDALPILITTVVIVTNFDPRRGAMQGLAMVAGNILGGIVAVLALAVLQTAPSLANLSLLAVLIGAVFAPPIARGGANGSVALVSYNQAMVMFGLALVPGGADTGLWFTRVLQFAVASLFAVGMMTLLLGERRLAKAAPQVNGHPNA